MFIKRFELFKLCGFPIRIDVTWFIIVVLLTWSLAKLTFPHFHEGLSNQTYWMMGLVGTIGLFVSVLLHELGHAIAARRYGIQMDGITLFIFGGVAEMRDEPPSAIAEFVVAIGGPLVTVALMILFAGAWMLGGMVETIPGAATSVLGWLAAINTVLLVFNMIPAFPLDGGRVLRSLLWQTRGSLRWATRITSQIGASFGLMLIILGVLIIIATPNIIGGIWMGIIGLFLRSAATASYQQLLIRKALEGEPVSRFMVHDPVTVPPEITIEQFVNEVIYRYYHKMYPVVDENDRLLGCITTRQVKDVSHDEWSQMTVRDIAQPTGEENTISMHTDAMQAMSRMNRTEQSRLMVLDGNGELIGIVSLKDLLRFLSMKVELEDDDAGSVAIAPMQDQLR